MPREKLKHCPFCGSKMVNVGANKECVFYSSVYCNQCGLEATWYHDDDEEAAEHWNRRVSIDEAENKRLKEIDHQIFLLKAEKDDIILSQSLRKEKYE
jgi:Lar family restriction alleviation protein